MNTGIRLAARAGQPPGQVSNQPHKTVRIMIPDMPAPERRRLDRLCKTVGQRVVTAIDRLLHEHKVPESDPLLNVAYLSIDSIGEAAFAYRAFFGRDPTGFRERTDAQLLEFLIETAVFNAGCEIRRELFGEAAAEDAPTPTDRSWIVTQSTINGVSIISYA